MTAAHPLLALVATLPTRPGVYRFLASDGRVLYVGKAKSLKKRVSSYFIGLRGGTGTADDTLSSTPLSPRIQVMLQRARNLEVTVTTTENEALILEANLIKRFHPPYNVLLKDDKSHPYLHLSTDHAYPRLTLRRGLTPHAASVPVAPTVDPGPVVCGPSSTPQPGRLFGPFPSVRAVRETLKWLQRLFPIRQCEENQFKQRQRPCLQYQIKRCTAPCCARISATGYADLVREVTLFLEGKDKVLLELLKQSMWQASAKREFEEAAQLRDRIKAISLVQDQRRVNLAENSHLDIFGVAQDASGFAVQVFFVRNGINLGNSHFFPENSEGLTVEALLEAFLSQYYVGKGVDTLEGAAALQHLPEEILVSHVLGQRRWLADALSRLRGGPVRIHKPTLGEKRRLLNMAILNAEQALESRQRRRNQFDQLLRQLAEVLGLPHPLQRIEAYDVSHFQGSHPVGSMIVFGPEGWQKQAYRRFSLQDPELRDDTARMGRMLARRLARLLPNTDTASAPLEADGQETRGPSDQGAVAQEEEWPDLLLLDGGRGQLQVALATAATLPLPGLHFCAIAKGDTRPDKQEQLFLPGQLEPIILPDHSPVLFLLQNIRDEAHRCAVGLHRVQRAHAQTRSVLDQISGIGPQKKRSLLRHFGSVQALQSANVAELLAVTGVSESLAHRIVQFFQEEL